jgi:hypothetical protein
VIKFGAASISKKAARKELLPQRFMTTDGIMKVQTDQYWVKGQWGFAKAGYQSIRNIDCTHDILSCERAQRRVAHHKPVKFKHDRDALERRSVQGVQTHTAWDSKLLVRTQAYNSAGGE